MAFGPGKYDDLCTEVREKSKAKGVVLIVIEGDRGFGLSVQAESWVVLELPETLRRTAQLIADDLMRGET
jgi:hypothetical protein